MKDEIRTTGQVMKRMTVATLVLALLAFACGGSSNSAETRATEEERGTSYRDSYTDGPTEIRLFHATNEPAGGNWSDIALIDESSYPADFGTSSDVRHLIGMSEAIIVGTVVGVTGPFRIEREGDGDQTSGAVDGVFWVDVHVDQVLGGETLAEGETMTHAVSVVLDLDSGGVFQFKEDPIPEQGSRLIFFIEEFTEFDDLVYARITGVGSGRVAESRLERALGVPDTQALAGLSRGSLGLIAAENRARRDAADVTGTTLPASD